MKKLFIRLMIMLMMIGTSIADERFVAKNDAGGQIILLGKKCVVDGQDYSPAKLMMSTSSTGEVTKGCWEFDETVQKPHVVYLDGTERYYDVGVFKHYKK